MSIILDHPYRDLGGGHWLRGNLHAHTTRSDGRSDPQAVIDAYASRGYGFLMISDHDIYTSPKDHAQWDSRGMILIPGNEISAGGPHLLHVNANRRVEPLPDRHRVIDQAASDGGLVIVNHPNWGRDFNHCPQELMETWTGYTGLEIYNGVIEYHPGYPYATDRWDLLLARGRRVWGYATDDSHEPRDVAAGWVVAHVRQRSVEEVVQALAAGRFYASTGVIINSIEVEGMKIRIETENAGRIAALREWGRRYAVADARDAEFDVPTEAKYVRIECLGPAGQSAWTQPFFIAEADH